MHFFKRLFGKNTSLQSDKSAPRATSLGRRVDSSALRHSASREASGRDWKKEHAVSNSAAPKTANEMRRPAENEMPQHPHPAKDYDTQPGSPAFEPVAPRRRRSARYEAGQAERGRATPESNSKSPDPAAPAASLSRTDGLPVHSESLAAQPRRRRADRWRQESNPQMPPAPQEAAQEDTVPVQKLPPAAQEVPPPAPKQTRPPLPQNPRIKIPEAIPPFPKKTGTQRPAAVTTLDELEVTGAWFDGIIKVEATKPEPTVSASPPAAMDQAMQILAKDDGIMQRDMARRMEIDPQGLNVLLVDMIAKGLVIRKYSKDRTIAYVHLTDDGKRALGMEVSTRRPEVETPAATGGEALAGQEKNDGEASPDLNWARDHYANVRIADLDMSSRAANALMRAGYRNASELVGITEEILLAIRNMGRKSAEEVLAMSMRLARGEVKQPTAPRTQRHRENRAVGGSGSGTENGYLYATTIHCMMYDVPVSSLRLPKRARETLYSLGYTRTKQLSGLSFDTIAQLPNVGAQMAIDITNALEDISVRLPVAVFTDAYRTSPQYKAAAILAQQCASLCIIRPDVMEAYLAQGIEAYVQANGLEESGLLADDLLEDGALIEQLFAEESLHKMTVDKVMAVIGGEPYGVPMDELRPHLPAAMQAHGLVGDLLEDMHGDGLVTLCDGVVSRRNPPIASYIDGIEDDRRRTIMQMWMQAQTLDAIGGAVSLTRERVRQIIENEKRRFPAVEEDQYRPLFARYAFTREAFEAILDAPPQAWPYLDQTEDRGEMPLERLVEDISIPPWIRKRAQAYIFRGTLLIDGQRIRRTRNDLADYVLRTKCRDEVSFEAFARMYDGLLEAQQIEQTSAFVLTETAMINRLANMRNVLWKQGKRLRYYDIDQYDFTELLDMLALDQYEGVEYSTLKFFREYPALMQAYDIRDEYELHNLLRKVATGGDYARLSFKRMPCIAFGDVDRDRQVLSLMMQRSPISQADFALAYEEAYGVRAATVTSGYLKPLEPYLHDGQYRMDIAPLTKLSAEAVQRMKAVLTEDFYTIAQIKELYLMEVPDADARDMNAYAIAELGYKVYVDYAVRDAYSTATEYFQHLLLQDEVVDVGGYPQALQRRMQWTINELERSYTLIGFSPSSYVSLRRLQSAGITREQLAAYGQDVSAFVDEGEMFTLFSLRRKGFVHALDALGFDEMFYASLLRQRDDLFTSQRIGQARVFAKGAKSISRTGFIQRLILPVGRMDIYDLAQLMQAEYGVTLEKAVIVDLVRGSDMHYDTIMERVYIDYKTYFEEV